MYRSMVIYVPDELWAKLGTEIHHFEYHSPTPNQSVAVYTDGRREEFDSEVTPERVAREREKWLGEMRDKAARGEIVFKEYDLNVPAPRLHGQIVRIE
jgi:hypothetical protein